ncbi:dermonecrotic toxin domain-containing protein [Pseudomonas putida]|uniref:dermonecrotic toxin domain-containing protein n=1 Tax=Pseudomonas putida TaxID=303 RepID=UPI0008191208|nr:DUF6543 domain-containing protein [Pseudomonas putida]OCT25728.1 mannosyltransferase [Pseudomonas putida]OCT27651.1 mannosyltransferase [Pseudomonas putida]OCT32150.1 mannosyltransferase [Pseudomonas putida]OCT38978.1 mannosyltransferase [Pseudomonas putida]
MSYIPAENLHLVSDALIDFPRPDSLAQTLLRTWLQEQGVQASPHDIDVVTVHYQLEPIGEGRGHFRENAVISQKMNLVEALLGNWQGETASGFGGFHYGDWAGTAPSGALTLVERLEPESELSNYSAYEVFNGLYLRQDPEHYSPANLLAVRAEALQGFIWSLHFHTLYKDKLDHYWKSRLTSYQRATKINLIAACNHQVRQGSLSEEGRRMVWEAAGIARHPGQPVKASMLNVYGYVSTSILKLHAAHTALVVLYIPGNSSPLLEFVDATAMQHWFAQQCQAADKRAALLQLFSPADWPDGLDYSGLRTALTGLGLYPYPHRLGKNHPGLATSGFWKPADIIDYRADHYSPPISEELFGYLAQRQQQRSYADADSQIVSNHQIDKARWTSYLNVTMTMLAPIAMVVPALTPFLLLGGLTQFGLGMDKAINGRSLEEKADGAAEQGFGLFNALPLIGNAISRPTALFSYCRPGFVSFSDLLPAEDGFAESIPLEDLSSAEEALPAEAAFREQAVLPCSATSTVVVRVDENLRHRFAAWLKTDEGLENHWVLYEARSDSFIKTTDLKQANPPRWAVDAEHPFALIRLEDDARQATDTQRMITLRALNIHVNLPIDYSVFDTLEREPLERLITSVWVGNRRMDATFIEAISHNAKALRTSQYRYQLLLSRQDMPNFNYNVGMLAAKAPNLQILTLEEQPFFLEFERSPYYVQYQAALVGDGKGTTLFSSASDILRYRVLKYFGGLYIDADDTLLLSDSKTPRELPLEHQDLRCSRDGLVLSPPVSNDQLGMYIKYNNSLIGSHAGNPTLDSISDEILRRYRLEPGFYSSRPNADIDPVGLNRFTRRLSMLTGPGVLNDVIDQKLPELRQLREICNLLVSPLYDAHQIVDLKKLHELLKHHAGLGEVAQIGRAHSWLVH